VTVELLVQVIRRLGGADHIKKVMTTSVMTLSVTVHK
jgi:hypothetical protein